MRGLRRYQRASDVTTCRSLKSNSAVQHAVQLEFACILVGQKSDKFGSGMLTEKEIAAHTKGLQSLYT